ncbi:PEP-CTERM sorting domain-containing protein [Puniceicoccales bacterium CK1056]|uniref:PEP-CTERM sorting domain-containing protein n=1 Tax=Oceanipulchritudo coccoides TaxID=2706888 RepID=A0A6B2M1T5_9BACT|nr:PEP-CTERM sorting domain-containing protein [Oceanipulchritudo coccoides]NDV62336.1 PEP-CTERM sorting domain-containing protein [Oceanipulchritudo coccoides]
MRKLLKLAVCAGIVSPFCASAQLITVNEPSTSGSFNALISLMAADGAALHVGNGEANATAFTQLYWDVSASAWEVGSLSTDIEDFNFQLRNTNVQYFVQTGPTVDVGFVSNENWDLDELFINAYAVGDLGNSDPRVSLFDYSSKPGSTATDVPGDTAELVLADGVSAPVILEFEHINQTVSPLGPLYQSNEIRFNMFQGVNVDAQGAVVSYIKNEWLFGINDKNTDFDGDGDDGYFYFSGDIRPVPEPSQIAALSLLGLGAFLFVRRRLMKRGK